MAKCQCEKTTNRSGFDLEAIAIVINEPLDGGRGLMAQGSLKNRGGNQLREKLTGDDQYRERLTC